MEQAPQGSDEIPGSIQKMCGCGTQGFVLVVDMTASLMVEVSELRGLYQP